MMKTTHQVTSGAWIEKGACRGLANADPVVWNRMFFPTEEKPDISEARAICSNCPVRYECADFAIRERIIDGVWGGAEAKKLDRWRRKWLTDREPFEASLADALDDAVERILETPPIEGLVAC